MNRYAHPATNLIVTTLLSKMNTSSNGKRTHFRFLLQKLQSVSLDYQNAMHQIQIGRNLGKKSRLENEFRCLRHRNTFKLIGLKNWKIYKKLKSACLHPADF